MSKSMRQRSTSNGRGAAQAQAGGTDMLRMRKELIQSRSRVADLQDELQEKTSHFLRAVKEKEDYKERLNNARGNIDNFEQIVAQKVKQAVQKERNDMDEMKRQNENLKNLSDTRETDYQQIKLHNKELNEQLAAVRRLEDQARVKGGQSGWQIEVQRLEHELAKEKESNMKLLKEYNTLSVQVNDILAENRQLRTFYNVPENFGVDRENIKVLDQERIEDFKKLIGVLQSDNYTLEKERASLKHQLKTQAMLYQNGESEPSKRYKNLTEDELFKVDKYAMRLKAGDAEDGADMYGLKKAHEELKRKYEALQTSGVGSQLNELKQQMTGLGLQNQSQNGNNNGIESGQLTSLHDNQKKLHQMLETLISQGGVGMGQTQSNQDLHSMHVQGLLPAAQSTFKSSFAYPSGNFQPIPDQPNFEGEINGGITQKFSNSRLPVIDQNGNQGIRDSNVQQHAFLQIQLQEVFEINNKNEKRIEDQKEEINYLYGQIKQYILVQDQLYKDTVRVERHFKTKEESLTQKIRNLENELQEQAEKTKLLDDTLGAFNSGSQQTIQDKLLDLTKKNSIHEMRLLRLTRKYNNLEEQEKMLRREYHAKEADMHERDIFVQDRINKLKEWKASAIMQMSTLFDKLQKAAPMQELKEMQNELVLEKSRFRNLQERNKKVEMDRSELQTKLRNTFDHEQKTQIMKEDLESLEEEFAIVTRKLERFDQSFKWVNGMYRKVASILQRAEISPLQAFEAFDKDQGGTLDKDEFFEAMTGNLKMEITRGEYELLWSALDADRSGDIDYKEFVRKLQRYGLRNIGREENILYTFAKTMKKANMKISEMFQMFDKQNRGYITRQDFKDIFNNFDSLKDTLNEQELSDFIDNFWRDKTQGIDYKGFLSIFKKYEIQVENDTEAAGEGNRGAIIDDVVIRKKKEIFDLIDEQLQNMNKSIKYLFELVDTDGNLELDVDEMFDAFKRMNLPITQLETQQLFTSIDFDGSGEISLPEFQADFRNVIATSVHQLVASNQESNTALVGPQSTYVTDDAQRLFHLEESEKRVKKRLTNYISLYKNCQSLLSESQQAESHLSIQNEDITKQMADMKAENFELKADKDRKSNREENDQESKIEQLKSDLVETRAALLSYRNMCNVISDQAKNLKLMQERKKDEHENLLEALREMQSESTTKERVGKLYFIIMLSRWQEASVNKKYDAVVSEVRNLRQDLILIESEKSQNEEELQGLHTNFRAQALKLAEVTYSLENHRGVYITEKKAREFQRDLENLSDDKTKLEADFYNNLMKLKQAEAEKDKFQAMHEEQSKLCAKLQNETQNEQSDSLIEMSQLLQAQRLRGHELNRKNGDLNARVDYLNVVMKQQDGQLVKLEMRETEAQGLLEREKENYRKMYDDKVAFFSKMTNQKSNNGAVALGGNSNTQHVTQRLNMSANLSQTGTKHLEKQVIENARVEYEGTGSNWTAQAELDKQIAKNKQLEEQCQIMTNELNNKGTEISRMRMWQEGDRYLSEDMVMKNAIEDHRLKTLHIAEQEQKEISDAAYETVKTLQEMINQKNEHLKRKEDDLKSLRQQMKTQAQLHATEINKLNEKMSLTNNTTMTKMHAFMTKQETDPSAMGQTTGSMKARQATDAISRRAQEELMQRIQQQDHIIQQLKSKSSGSQEVENMSREQVSKLRNEVQALEDQLRTERARVDIKSKNKQLMRLQEDNKRLIVKQKAQTAALEEVKAQMLKFDAEKHQADKEDEIAIRKKQFELAEDKKQKDAANTRLDMIKTTNNELKQKNGDLVNQTGELEDKIKGFKLEIVQLKEARDQTEQKYQNSLKNANQRSTTSKTVGAREESKTSGGASRARDLDNEDLGRLTEQNEEQYEKIRELEQENIRLAQRTTVVTKHPEFGTFEYIGTPQPLTTGRSSEEAKTPQAVIDLMTAIIKKNDRVTVGPIFRSLDRGRFGELKEADFRSACRRMGIELSQSNVSKLQEVLDKKRTGYLKYGPIVHHLSGMPTKEFINPAITKLAYFIQSQDLEVQEFKRLLVSGNESTLRQTEFKQKIQNELRSASDPRARQAPNRNARGAAAQEEDNDFNLFEEEIDSIFNQFARNEQQSTAGYRDQKGTRAVLVVDELIKEVYVAVRAVMINMMQTKLKKSGKFLVDLLQTRDTNRDGYLEYLEFESMLSEDLNCQFKPKLFDKIILYEFMDPEKRKNKIKNDLIKMYLGEGEAGMLVGDMIPTQQNQRAGRGPLATAGAAIAGGKQDKQHIKLLQDFSRKLLVGFQGTLGDALNKEDPQGDGLLPVETVQTVVDTKNITALQPSELQALIQHCDSNNYGFLIISNFHAKLLELAQETEQEVKLRRFAKSIGNQGLNLRAELAQYDRQRRGELDQAQFKRAMKQLAVPLTDAEIKEMFEFNATQSRSTADKSGPGQLEIAPFCAKVTQAQRSKPLPAYLNSAAKPGAKVGSRIGQGAANAISGNTPGSQFENWEIEKKYKRNLEALKTEIEERNREILLAQKEVHNVNQRVLRLEGDKQELENKLVNKHSKPPREMQADSEHFGNMDEIQKLKDEIFHLQQVNTALQKTMQVGLKAECGKAYQEKELLEDRLKNVTEKLRQKIHDNQMLMGQPMDAIGQRETLEESRQQRIEELENDLFDTEQRASLLQEQLFKAEEQKLDLKFEKETFDLQYARLQKRITDLEQFKLQSSSISANLENQRKVELATIKEQTTKLTGEEFSNRGDTVKLRNRKLKSVQELETVIDTLRRVIDKQKVEMDNFRKENTTMKSKIGDANSAQEAQQLRRKCEALEQALHSAEMKEVNMDEQERTMKKLIYANKQLRDDLSREIERYNLLEDKFRDLLVKYNLANKQNEQNQKLVFAMGTGASLPRYDNFLDEGGEFTTSGKKRANRSAIGENNGLDDSLNKLNRDVFDNL